MAAAHPDNAIWINCNGGPYTIENPRGLSWSITSGWGAVIDRLLPLAAGRLVLLHNPFGRTSKEGLMEFDQYFNCQRLAATKALIDSFNKNIERLVLVAKSVVVYIGAPHNSQRMIQALNTPNARGVDNWLYQAWYNVQPIVESGCSIGIDNMGKVDIPQYEQHWIRHIQSLLQAHGRDAWIEATTEFSSPLHDQFPMFVTNANFQLRHVNVNSNAASRYPNVAVAANAGNGAAVDGSSVGVDKGNTTASSWYKQQVGVLLRSVDYPTREELDARCDFLRARGVLPVLQFSILESLGK